MAAAEKAAQAAKLGIWSMPNQTPPWDFRRGKGVAKLEIGQADTRVFVSRTGTKYHRDDCRFVSKSKLATTLARARGRYTPCSTCAPPVLKEMVKLADPADAKRKVYVTRSGTKYHSDGCRFLSKSKIAVALANARRSHTPCSRCAPPK